MLEERYKIIKLLGKGRTGGVYEAEDTHLKRKVAMRRFFSQCDQIEVSDYKEDFVAISQNLSALQHPNLLRVYDAGVDTDGAFIISQLLMGDTLHNRLKEKPLSAWDVYDVANQMLDALSTAHHAGFVHGAITPGSILMSPRARGGHLYVILDMGLCRLAPLIQGEDSVLLMMADPAILAPELFDGALADVRTDLYMLGHILYMCLAGGHPFAGESLEECGKLHKKGLPPLQIYATDVLEDFIEWINWLCMINPIDRPESTAQALAALPKVAKPVRSTQIRNNPVSPPQMVGTGSQLARGQLSTFTGNPASHAAGTQVVNPTGISQVPLPIKKNSKVLPLIIGGVVITALIGTLIMATSGKEDKGTIAKAKEKIVRVAEPLATPTAAEIAEEKSLGEKKKQVLGLYINDDDSIKSLSTYDTSKKWRSIDGGSIQQSDNELGFSDTSTTDNPGIKHGFSRSQVNDIFDLGWLVTYKVKVKSGKHIVGWNLSDAQNSEWMNADKGVSWGINIERDGEDVIITDYYRNSHSLKLNDNGDKEIEITAQCRPGDIEGYYDVYINGEKIWRSRLNQSTGFGSNWNKNLFSASSVDPANQAEWSFSELSMKTIEAD